MRDLEAELAQALRERDDALNDLANDYEVQLHAERARAKAAEADADRLAAAIEKAPEWWSEDMDTGSLLDAHAAAVEARGD